MEINEALIKHVAKVARLDLTDEEVAAFTPQLKEVIEAFARLNEVNTEDVEPSFQPIVIRNRLREDVPGEVLTQEKALSLSTHTKDGYFKGPRAV